jgi:hypothetical protein
MIGRRARAEGANLEATARKPGNVRPNYRDLASRALLSPFDCGGAKQLLGWTPVADRERFIESRYKVLSLKSN